MADSKLSALTAREATVGDPFNDLLYYYVAAGATDADKQRKTTPFDVLMGAARKMSWAFHDLQKPDEGSLGQGATGSGSVGAANNTEGNHPGIYNLDTGTDTTGAAYIFTSNAFGFKVGGGQIRFLCWLKTGGTLSTGTQRYGLFFGLSDAYNSFAPSNCIFVRYREDTNSGKWQLCCRNGGTESVVDITVTVAVDTWYRIQIDINAAASSITATVNGTESAAVTTNISTTEMHLIGGILKAVGTTARDFYLDFLGWMQHFTTAR